MEIIISKKPKAIFNAELDKITDSYTNFENFFLGENSNDDLSMLTKIQVDSRILVFTAEGASTLNNLVFEKIPDFIKVFREMNLFDTFFINNPSNLLIKTLEQVQDIVVEPPFCFSGITEVNIKNLSDNFNNRIIGQRRAKEAILRALIRLIVRKKSKKPLVLMFFGKPGIGKTETAKYLAEQLFEGDIIREQMSMTSNESSLNYFQATKHSENSFSKTLMNRSSNVILLDEFALSHSSIHGAFFQLFDEGVYSDNNFTVDMKNSIIICTSNILKKEDMYKQIDEALLSRFDAFIEFDPFTIEDKKIIIDKIVKEYRDELEEYYQKQINWDKSLESLKEFIPELTNMRNIKNFVEEYFANQLLYKIVNGISESKL